MKLSVLASGSKANCYILHNDSEALIIETGVRFKEVQKELDYDVLKIKGCIISHEHGDHGVYLHQYLDAGIDVYSNEETFINRKIGVMAHRANRIKANQSFNIGNYKILPFRLFHDVPCHGFLINHQETGNILFVTDTKQVPYNFPNLDHIMIECNYQQDIIDENLANGKTNLFLRNRVMHSHLDLEYVKQFLDKTDLTNVKNIVILHTSGHNSNPELIKKEISKLTRKNVYTAKKGLKLELNKEVF